MPAPPAPFFDRPPFDRFSPPAFYAPPACFAIYYISPRGRLTAPPGVEHPTFFLQPASDPSPPPPPPHTLLSEIFFLPAGQPSLLFRSRLSFTDTRKVPAPFCFLCIGWQAACICPTAKTLLYSNLVFISSSFGGTHLQKVLARAHSLSSMTAFLLPIPCTARRRARCPHGHQAIGGRAKQKGERKPRFLGRRPCALFFFLGGPGLLSSCRSLPCLEAAPWSWSRVCAPPSTHHTTTHVEMSVSNTVPK